MSAGKTCALVVVCAFAGLAQTAPAPQPFVPSNELNAELPKWLRFSGDYRARFEGYGGIGFRESNDAFLLNRFRINMQIKPTAWLKFNFQGQDAQVFGRNLKPDGPPFEDTMDLRLAFVEMGDPEKGTFSIRGGRQELVFGEQRLIGHVSWLNTARSFDAIRATMRHNGYRLDAFASSVVNVREGEINRRTDGNNFHGLYGGIEKLVPNAVIEPYVLWRLSRRLVTETGTRGNMDFLTYGLRMAGKVGKSPLDYGFEMATQAGGVGTDDVDAWAGHWRLGYTMGALRYKPRMIAEYNYATGDTNSRDGRRQTFDILYPTPHDKYGLSDQVGWKNIHHVRFGPEFKPHAKWLIQTNYHSWWLASRTDALYNAGGTPLFRSATGAAGRHVGQEVDAQAIYTMNKQIQIAAGYAHIIPGTFLKNVTPGKHFNFPYVSFGYAF